MAKSSPLGRRPELLVTADRLRAHIEHLAGKIGERHVLRFGALDAAREYIESAWRDQGYCVSRQWYDAMGVRCANLEITWAGSRRETGVLLIGAHYDTVPGSPGANDNGSGVAALLEISRLTRKFKVPMSVRFVAFVNEEPPFFGSPAQGSMVYAGAARKRNDDIQLMVALETIGFYSNKPGSQHYPPLFNLVYPRVGNFIGFVSDFRSWRKMRRLARAFRARSDFPIECAATFRFVPGVSWSDHWSFWQHSYRAVMVTDTAPYRYPYYHTAQDKPDELSYPEMARATDGLLRCFMAFAGASGKTRP